MRNLPADQAGIAALRHDRRARFVGELEDGRNFLDRARPQHHRRAAVIKVAHLDEIRLLRRLSVTAYFGPTMAAKRLKQFGVEAGLVKHVITLAAISMSSLFSAVPRRA